MRKEILVTILVLALVAVIIQFDVLQSLKNTSIGKKFTYKPNLFDISNEDEDDTDILMSTTTSGVPVDDEDPNPDSNDGKPVLPLTFGDCPRNHLSFLLLISQVPTYKTGTIPPKSLNLLPIPSEITVQQDSRLFLASDFKFVTTFENDKLSKSLDKYSVHAHGHSH